MASKFFSDAEVDIELERLLHSDDVRLAKKEAQIKNRKRSYMYQLRMYEKRGKQLAADGFTLDNIEARLFGEADGEWE